jgi:hypothetical protein
MATPLVMAAVLIAMIITAVPGPVVGLATILLIMALPVATVAFISAHDQW